MAESARSGTAAWLPSAGAPRPGTRPFQHGSEEQPDPDPPLAAGTVLGARYQIIRLLGEGGMGRVYEAMHAHLDRRVAVKLLRRDKQAQPEAVRRFEQEARAASRIGHRNIVEVIDFARLDDGRVYMVMEMLEGESLEEWLHRPGRLDEGVRMLVEICEGLDAAHRAGVVHRDVKPANAFIRSNYAPNEGRVKLLDFGIAKMTVKPVDGFETQAGSVVGTPYYLAPERILGDKLTPAADLYSVGVMLYELLTGNVPFVADTFMAILARHVKHEALDPRQAAPDRPLPDGISELALRLLAKDPERRPAGAANLAAQLRQLLASEGTQMAEVVTGLRDEDAAGTNSTIHLDAPAEQGTHRIQGVTPIANQPARGRTEIAGSNRSLTAVQGSAASAAHMVSQVVEEDDSATFDAPPRRPLGLIVAVACGASAVAGVLAWWATSGRVEAVDAEPAETADVAAVPDAPSEADLAARGKGPETTPNAEEEGEPEGGTGGKTPSDEARAEGASPVETSTDSGRGSKKGKKPKKSGKKPKKPKKSPDKAAPDAGPTIKDDVYDE